MRETPRAKQAWADYLALGPGRSLERLFASYEVRRQTDGKTTVPARRFRTIEAWSSRYNWQARLKEIADQAAREAEERELAYRREIMETGYALAHERVAALKRLAAKLYEELMADGDACRRWLKDAKQAGSERFNAAEVEQLRGILDDIAREKGERQGRHEVSGPGGGPIQIVEVVVERSVVSLDMPEAAER